MTSSFADFKLNPQLLNAIADAGFEEPTHIQQKAITPILSGQDVIGIAQTGTGKTAAYVLPLLMKLKYAQGHAPRVLILAPTRELAMQIDEHVQLFAKYTNLRVLAIYGGIGPKAQKEALTKGTDMLIATPGRFLDLYATGNISTKGLLCMVLDEADKMMDMGFIGSIRRILEIIPRRRQNLLFSATMGSLVKKIAGDFLKFPILIEVSAPAAPPSTIVQELYKVPNLKTKLNLLQYLLKHETLKRLIIFCKTKITATQIAHFLGRKYGTEGIRLIHANKGQNTRINAMKAFKEGGVRMLVTTDVAARGLDITMVSHVINFDVPLVIEDYIHRIGRTGRAHQKGQAITFCTKAEKYYVEKIEQLMQQKIPVKEVPLEVAIEETPYEENQVMNREIDQQRRKEDPTFLGAFHEKKFKKAKTHSFKPTKQQGGNFQRSQRTKSKSG